MLDVPPLARQGEEAGKGPVANLGKVAARVRAANVGLGDEGRRVPPVRHRADVDGAGERLAERFNAVV